MKLTRINDLYYQEVNHYVQRVLAHYHAGVTQKPVENYLRGLTGQKKEHLEERILGAQREMRLMRQFVQTEAFSRLNKKLSERAGVKDAASLQHLAHYYAAMGPGVEGYFSIYQFPVLDPHTESRSFALGVMGGVFSRLPFFFQKRPRMDLFEIPGYRLIKGRIDPASQERAVRYATFYEADSLERERSQASASASIKHALDLIDQAGGLKGLAATLEIPPEISLL